MNNSRLNGAYTLQECSRNMNTSDLTISKSDDNMERSTSQDTSDCQTQSNHLQKSENDSELFATQSKRIKTAQRLTLTKPEFFKKSNDNSRYESPEYNGTDDSQVDDGTDISQNGDIPDDRQDDDSTDDSQEDGGTDDSQENGGTEDGHKDRCYNTYEADLFYGTHETQVSEGGEADLHKHIFSCNKNPGHTQFVPVNNFNVNHLPKGHHDNDLVDFIKATADLTVRLAVMKTSKDRPEFWPNTHEPYPFYDKRGSDVTKLGTGMVTYVNKHYKETCPCHKCQHSDTPSNVWGKVEMFTARHVVFDDLEARHTTCRLFYDGQDSTLVTLDGWTVMEADIEEDRCKLECVTCDVDLLDKLGKMCGHWWVLWMKVHNKYKSSGTDVKLTFIVSHPHGCPKQISVGHWINRYVLDKHDIKSKYTYTTCTCPGSSGAHVHSLGYDNGWLSFGLHVHSGVNSKGNNFSGTGRDWR